MRLLPSLVLVPILLPALVVVVLGFATATTTTTSSSALPDAIEITHSFPGTHPRGWLRIYLTPTNNTLPMSQASDDQDTAQVFGFMSPLNGSWAAGQFVAMPTDTLGYPIAHLSEIDSSEYYFVQAELVPYEVYRRAGLPPTLLPKSCVSFGSGSDGAYGKPGGTLYSEVMRVRLSDYFLPPPPPPPPPFAAAAPAPASAASAAATAAASTSAYAAISTTTTGRSSSPPLRLTLSRRVSDTAADSPGCAGLGPGVDSYWIKTVRINSTLLSRFWQRDIELEACVLLPYGWHDAEHASARYPTVVSHGHFSPLMPASGGGPWRTNDPHCDPDEPVSPKNPLSGYDCVQAQYGYLLYRNWTSTAPDGAFTGARVLLMTVNHPTPFFDDSYAVDSESTGPYGSAINTELIPEVERRYRGIGQGWARGVYGGSTGGWEAAATQVLYPDLFNGAYAACPDPVTFSHYVTTDIYNSHNMFYYDSAFRRTPRPAQRDHYSGQTWPGFGHPYGDTVTTVGEANRRELVLGSHSRSCGQWDVWEQVFSPVDKSTGFPMRMYDKVTGDINAS
eukprot:UC1_evm1s1980